MIMLAEHQAQHARTGIRTFVEQRSVAILSTMCATRNTFCEFDAVCGMKPSCVHSAFRARFILTSK